MVSIDRRNRKVESKSKTERTAWLVNESNDLEAILAALVASLAALDPASAALFDICEGATPLADSSETTERDATAEAEAAEAEA